MTAVPSHWPRIMRDPVVASGLLVDLIPVFAVVSFGWGAFELVLLYWIENLIIGGVTLSRILLSGFGQISKAARSIFLSIFFTVHYGIFCLVHGAFLFGVLGGGAFEPTGNSGDLPDLSPASGIPGLVPILGVVIAWQVYFHVIEFVRRGDNLRTEPIKEMFSPYGRIVVLHLGIFAGAFALENYGEPMLGVLALILFRAVIGVVINLLRHGNGFQLFSRKSV